MYQIICYMTTKTRNIQERREQKNKEINKEEITKQRDKRRHREIKKNSIIYGKMYI